MIAIWLMSAKFVTLGFLKIKVFLNKDCDGIISIYDGINKFYHITQITL